MLKDITSGMEALKSQRIVHGDIQPSNIFVMDNKTLKLVDSGFINDGRSGFQRQYQEHDYKTPLGPQAVACLLRGKGMTAFDKEKNDIWATGNNFFLMYLKGITVLSTIFNENYNSYYDWQSYEINYELLKKRLVSLKKDLGYSTEFVDVMTKILKKDENKRYSIFELSEKLRHKRGIGGRNSIGSLHLEQSPIPHRYQFEDESSFNFTGIQGVNGNHSFPHSNKKSEKMEETKTQASTHYNQNYPPNQNNNFQRMNSPGIQQNQLYGNPQQQQPYYNQQQQQQQYLPQQNQQYQNNNINQNAQQYQNNYSNHQNQNQGHNNQRNGPLRGSYGQQSNHQNNNSNLRGTQGSFKTNPLMTSGSQSGTIRGTQGSYKSNPLMINNSKNGALRGSYNTVQNINGNPQQMVIFLFCS